MVLHKTCHSTGAKTIAPAKVVGHREVEHRAANSSQFVSGLLRLHARQSPNSEGYDALTTAVFRIFSVAGVRRQICRLEPQDTADVASYHLDPDAALEQGCADDAQRLPATGGCVRSFLSPLNERSSYAGYHSHHGFLQQLRGIAAESLFGAATQSTPARAPAGAMHLRASTEALAHESGFNARVRAGVHETGFVRLSQRHTLNNAASSACVPDCPRR
jgi:hypothetical protein